MRWRLIVLGGLAVVLAAFSEYCVWQAGALLDRGQKMYQVVDPSGPSQAVQEAANRLFQSGYVLQQLVTPIATGAVVSGLAVLILLARRRQLQDLDRSGPT